MATIPITSNPASRRAVTALKLLFHVEIRSSITTTLANVAVGAYGSLPISTISERTFNDVASVVVGSGTSFTSDFIRGDRFIADSQYFIVDGIANNTYMTVNVSATPPYSGVFAYKQLA